MTIFLSNVNGKEELLRANTIGAARTYALRDIDMTDPAVASSLVFTCKAVDAEGLYAAQQRGLVVQDVPA